MSVTAGMKALNSTSFLFTRSTFLLQEKKGGRKAGVNVKHPSPVFASHISDFVVKFEFVVIKNIGPAELLASPSTVLNLTKKYSSKKLFASSTNDNINFLN